MLGSHPEWTMTGRLELRYRRYVPYGPLLRVRASLSVERRRMHQASGVLTLASDERTVYAEAQGTFMLVSTDAVDMIVKEYPEARKFFGESS